ARVRQSSSAAIEDPIANGGAPARTAHCLTPTELAAWLSGAMSEGGLERRMTHLDTCASCLAEAMAASRTLRRLSSAPLPVPAALMARVASRWPLAEPDSSSLTSLVIRVTRAGAQLLERTLVAPIA